MANSFSHSALDAIDIFQTVTVDNLEAMANQPKRLAALLRLLNAKSQVTRLDIAKDTLEAFQNGNISKSEALQIIDLLL